MRQALEVFAIKSNSMDWDIFASDVKKELHRYSTMDIEETKVPKVNGSIRWSDDGPEDFEPFEIIQTVVSCPEKEQYTDFWSFYLKMPMVTDPKVVGTDSKLAIAEPQLFLAFRESGTKLTFTAWLNADADFVASVTEPTFDAWLNAPRNTTRKHNRATYVAYKSGKYSGVSWRQLKHYINLVVSVDSEMTIQTFVENEYFATIWASSSASRNIGTANGGIPFATFATTPYQYQEFYEHGYNTRGVSFATFLEDKADGWILTVPRCLKKQEVLSLAWLSPELVTKDMLANIKKQLWRVSNLTEFNEQPSRAFNIINNTTTMMVPRSVCDEQLFELLCLLLKKSTDASAIRNLLQQIPTTVADASELRKQMCACYESEMTAKFSRKHDAFIGLVNTQSNFETIECFLTSLPTEDEIAQVHQFIDSLPKRKRELANTFFDDFIRVAKVCVSDNTKAIADNIMTDVHTIQKVIQKSDVEEISVVHPSLIQSAHEYLLKLSESKTSTKVSSTKATKAVEVKASVQKSMTATAEVSAVDLDIVSGQFRADAVFSKAPVSKTQTKLQKSGRVQLYGNQNLYIVNTRITKERSTINTSSYWVVGPFETKSAASAVKSVVQRTIKTSGVCVEKYTSSTGLTVFETLIPDGADKVNKQNKKWGLDGNVVSAMKKEVLDKMTELIPHISKVASTSIENIVSSLVKNVTSKEETNNTETNFIFSDDDSDADSDVSSDTDSDADSDSEDEVTMDRNGAVATFSSHQDAMLQNCATQAQRTFGAANKSKRYNGPKEHEASFRGSKGPKGKDRD
jgi:hypothetical protein